MARSHKHDQIFVSTDIESDGPIPGPHSMLSFGSAAYTADKELISTFSANFDSGKVRRFPSHAARAS